MDQNVLSRLKEIELLSALPAQALEAIVPFCSLRPVRPGESLFEEGEVSEACYAILSGEIIVHSGRRDKPDSWKVLGALGPGTLFGESALYTDRPRTAGAEVHGGGVLVRIDGDKFRAWAENSPGTAKSVLMGLLSKTLERLQNANAELTTIHRISRLLASQRPLEERMHETLRVLKDGIPTLAGLWVYQRSPYWDEMQRVAGLPSEGVAESLSLSAPCVEAACHSDGPLVISAGQFADISSGSPGPTSLAGGILIPLLDQDDAKTPIQGMLAAAVSVDPLKISPHERLLLAAAAFPLAEAMARQRRTEDHKAAERLAQARQRFAA